MEGMGGLITGTIIITIVIIVAVVNAHIEDRRERRQAMADAENILPPRNFVVLLPPFLHTKNNHKNMQAQSNSIAEAQLDAANVAASGSEFDDEFDNVVYLTDKEERRKAVKEFLEIAARNRTITNFKFNREECYDRTLC